MEQLKFWRRVCTISTLRWECIKHMLRSCYVLFVMYSNVYVNNTWIEQKPNVIGHSSSRSLLWLLSCGIVTTCILVDGLGWSYVHWFPVSHIYCFFNPAKGPRFIISVASTVFFPVCLSHYHIYHLVSTQCFVISNLCLPFLFWNIVYICWSYCSIGVLRDNRIIKQFFYQTSWERKIITWRACSV